MLQEQKPGANVTKDLITDNNIQVLSLFTAIKKILKKEKESMIKLANLSKVKH